MRLFGCTAVSYSFSFSPLSSLFSQYLFCFAVKPVPLTCEQDDWLKNVELKEYIAVRNCSATALRRYRSALFFEFVTRFPDFYNPPFPEEPDMVKVYEARQIKVGSISSTRSMLIPSALPYSLSFVLSRHNFFWGQRMRIGPNKFNFPV